MTIFISIAAYRDPELGPTLTDCLRQARYPADLRFGVCWQRGEDETPPPDPGGGRLRRIDIPWQESRGACWARAEVMRLWQGEDFYFQIDSHHRFAEGWDALLLAQAERTGAARPLLTAYGTAYHPGEPVRAPGGPTRMKVVGLTRECVPIFDSEAMPEADAAAGPMRARCLSGHLLFTLGRFVEDVPYDPDLYFYGEEPTLALRAFTHGYSLYHPSVHILWHQWPRRTTPLHWTDHAAIRRDAASRHRAGRFLTAPGIGRFGCGTARTAAEYFRYAGIDPRRRTVSAEAASGAEPPQAPPPIEGGAGPRAFPLRLSLPRAALPPAALDRPAFWYVGFHDADGSEIARQDADPRELHRLLQAGGPEIVIERHINAARPPARWTVWPADRQRRWLGKLSGPVGADRCIIV